MQVLLFTPGKLQIQDTTQNSAPQQLSDDASANAALQQVLQQASSAPGTRLCIVTPGSTYSSPLRDALWNRVLESPQALPSLWLEAAAVTPSHSAAAGAQVDLATAMTHCKAIPIKEFAAY
jgi:hypothetical protein